MRKSKEEILKDIVPDNQVMLDEFQGHKIRFMVIDDVTKDFLAFEEAIRKKVCAELNVTNIISSSYLVTKKSNLNSYWKEIHDDIVKVIGCTQEESVAIFKLMSLELHSSGSGFSDASQQQIDNVARRCYEDYKSMPEDELEKLNDMIPDGEKYASKKRISEIED